MSFVVTIDGPAAAGKSTTARAVAEALGFLYVDTGALYRGLAVKVHRRGIRPEEQEAVARCVRDTQVSLLGTPSGPRVWIDGEEVGEEIRAPEVSELASRLAAQPPVRQRLIEVQRALRERGPLVAEGRDLGTVVFPDAEVKIYLNAELEARAGRRHRELEGRGIPSSLEEVRVELERRDQRDSTRADSPLRPASDAQVLDTTDIGVEEQVRQVLRVVRGHPAFPGTGPGAAGSRAAGPRAASGEGD